MRQTGPRWVLLAALLAAPGLAAALCLGGYPDISLAREVKESAFVIVGTPVSYRRVPDPEDPEGYAATLYWVRMDRVLRGRPPARLTIYNENTSARFPFDDPTGAGKGKRYLMLVRSDLDSYWVSACGHSGELTKSGKTMRSILRMVARPGR
jgi:hypothetical protein